MNETLQTEKEKRFINNALCGKCLHNRDMHEKHNGHFMYCPACQKLCDIDEFLVVHMPTEYTKVVEIGAKKQ